MTNRPHVFVLKSSNDRELASALISSSAVAGVQLTDGGSLEVRASDYGAFTGEIARVASTRGIRLLELLPTDESLESVFSYLAAS